MTREEVATNQQLRLGIAMMEAVGELGFVAVTVSEVVRRAGVSRKAFYQHFASKEECFLATYDAIVREGRRAIAHAHSQTAEQKDRLEAVLETLFHAATENRHAQRLAMIDVAALGAPGIERRELAIEQYGRLVHDGLEAAKGEGQLPKTTLRAIAGGFNWVLSTSLRAGRRAKPVELVPDLVRWAHTYHPPPQELLDGVKAAHGGQRAKATVTPTGGRAPGTLFPQAQVEAHADGRRLAIRRGSVSRSFVVQSQRTRILDAVTNLTAARGYGALTVEDIAGESGVSLQAFYEHFESKEDAFLVAYEFGHAKAISLVEDSFNAAPSWRDGVRDGLVALIDYLASEPAYARLALLGTLVSTPRATELFDTGVKRYSQLLAPGFDEVPRRNRPPPVAVDAIAGALHELFFHYAAQDRIRELPELSVDATYVALAPFIGAEKAALTAVETVSV